MANGGTIHTYEVGTTLELSRDEKAELAQFLVELSKRRQDIMGRIKFGTHGGFVLKHLHTYNMEAINTATVQELANNYSTEAGARVVGYVEGVI